MSEATLEGQGWMRADPLMDVGNQQERGGAFCGHGLDVDSSHRLEVLYSRSVSSQSCSRGD